MAAFCVRRCRTLRAPGLVAEFRREDVAVADGAGVRRAGEGRQAVQGGVEAFALDAAPDLAQHLAGSGAEVLDGVDLVGAQAGFHARADAVEVTQLQRVEASRQRVGRDGHEAVGFLHVAGGLGEEAVGSQPDRTGQQRTDLPRDGGLDAPGQMLGGLDFHPLAPQRAMHLVNRLDRGRHAALLDDRVHLPVAAHVVLRSRFDHLQAGAEPPRFVDRGARFDAVGLGLPAGGDAASGLRQQRDDHDRTVPQTGPEHLFDRGEKAVEVDEHRMQERLGHGRCLTQCSILFNKSPTLAVKHRLDFCGRRAILERPCTTSLP